MTDSAKPATILIVDQDEPSRQRLKLFLLDAHPEYRIFFAHDSMETLRVIAEHLPDLIFLDVLMPDNEGFDLCLLLKADERYKDIPVLIITALDRLEQKVRGFNMGASDYIVKPINAVETNARVQAQLRMKRIQDRQKELNAELRRAQFALLQSSKLSAVGALAAGVAHEFNNILHILHANAELCAATGSPDDVKNLLTVIRDCTERGGKIAKQLLDFSRSEENQRKEAVRLKELLEENLKLMGKTLKDKKITLSADLKEVPEFQGYPGQLSQVFVNLLKNAIDAMAESGQKKLTVTLALCGCESPLCAADPQKERPRGKGCALFTVEDSGCGIAQSIQEKIFEPFFTTKGIVGGGNVATPGTGLGLSVSYGIIRRHGGFVHFESRLGVGSRFSVWIPLT